MLLATDLDGTFLAGDPDNRLKLYRLVAAHPEIDLVFVTGRGLESVLPLLSDPTIPQPDYIIADVGRPSNRCKARSTSSGRANR